MSNLAGREAVRKQLEQDRRAVAFRPALAEIGGGVTAGLLLSQAWYWTERGGKVDGWFYKTQTEWEVETGLSRREQETARRRLVERGMIEEKRKGIPAKMHFRVRLDNVVEALSRLAKQPKQYARNGQTGAAEGAEQFGPEASDKEAREGQTGAAGSDDLLQENKQKTISKITAGDYPNLLFGADAPERDWGGGRASPEEEEGHEEEGDEESDYVGSPEYLRDFHRMEEILEKEVGPYRDKAKQGAAIKWILSQRQWTVEQCHICLLAQIEEYAYADSHIRAS